MLFQRLLCTVFMLLRWSCYGVAMVTTPDIFVWAAGRMKNAKFFQTMLFLHSSGYFDLLRASLEFCHYRHWSKSYQFLICCWCRRNTEIAVIQFSDFGWLYLCAKLFFLLQIFCGVFLNLSESDTRKKYEYFWFWKNRLKCLLQANQKSNICDYWHYSWPML